MDPKDPNCEETGSESYLIVRGFKDCPYHADILEKFEETELKADEELEIYYRTSCPGGGRINHDENNKKIEIYGYSQGFGRCDHQITQGYMQEEFPDYEITWSNEGY